MSTLRPFLCLATAVTLAACQGPSAASPAADSAASPTVTAASPSPTPSPTPTPTPTPTPEPKELPRGGTTIFPRFRLAGWCGYPGIAGQGRLGIGDVAAQAKTMVAETAVYGDDREVLPVMELIAVTVTGSPGADGLYRNRTSPAIIEQWLQIARANKALLLLNIQPGHASFLDEVKALEPWLSQPDVGLALDPEWAMKPGQKPGTVFGQTTGEVLDGVASYVAGVVAQHQLPEKVVVYHQLHVGVVQNEAALQAHPGVVMVKSVDGIGSPGAKIGTWQQVVANMPSHVHAGFKLFYEEDVQTSGVLMRPADVLALTPKPDYVLYE